MPKKRRILLLEYIKFHINRVVPLLLVIFIINSKDIYAQNLGLIQDAEIELNIREWIEPILDVANISSESVNIYIINDNSINAFVSGGQNIFINTGLILKSKEVNFDEVLWIHVTITLHHTIITNAKPRVV